MEDDIDPSDGIASRSPPKLSTNIDSLLVHLAPREDARRWAKNPRFLTFDDSEESKLDTLSSPGSEQCRCCAERAAIPAGHMCARHANILMTAEQLAAREESLHSYANPCVHVQELTCDGCRHVPLFPNRGVVSAFKIRRAALRTDDGQPLNCQHFVAVSYCWSSQGVDDTENGDDSDPYTVVEEDGSKRTMRAAKRTVDRAVAFARENGFRMIWIDQECIEQDKDHEKEMGINSMDLIYQHAHTCIGLLNTSWEQRHWEVLLEEGERVMGHGSSHRRGSQPPASRHARSSEYYQILIEAVLTLLRDPWNTRAWILQEAFVSADRMLLLFPRNGVDTDKWYLVCNEKSLTEVAINLDMMQDTLQASIFPLMASVQSPTRLPPRPEMSADVARFGSAFFDMTRYFYPRSRDSYGRIGFDTINIRRRCDAATALAYLNRRSLLRVADRIAILANLCGYEQRFNTVALEKTRQSLSLCILVLSIANGDLTLLTPEMYQTPTGSSLEFPSESDTDSDFSWVHSHTRNLHLVDSTALLPSSNTTLSEDARLYEVSSSGLSLLGTLWEVDQFVDLEPIRQKYADDWRLAKRPDADGPSQRQTISLILFEIIMLLKSKDMIQAADAILNSLSNPSWRSRDRDTGSDIVESILETPAIPATESQDIFMFSGTIGGMPHQSWLIDRIMNTGGVWLAKPVDCYQLPFAADMDAVFASKRNFPAVSRSQNLLSNKMLHGAGAEAAPIHTWLNHIFQLSSNLAQETHCGRLFSVALLTKLIAKWRDEAPDPKEINKQSSGTSENDANRPESSSLSSRLDALFSSIVPLAQWSLLLTGQVERSEFLDRRAVFDIEGSETIGKYILTPFQAQLESVPRSRARNLSVSWVVRLVQNDKVNEDKDEETRKLRVTGMVRGMWRYTFLKSGRFTLV